MAKYTPTTNGIRNRYLWWYEQQRDNGSKNFTKYPDEVLAEFDRWLEDHDAGVRKVTAADIADRIRLNCTPPSDAYARGGDALIYSVALWIETPPEWVKASWTS